MVIKHEVCLNKYHSYNHMFIFDWNNMQSKCVYCWVVGRAVTCWSSSSQSWVKRLLLFPHLFISDSQSRSQAKNPAALVIHNDSERNSISELCNGSQKAPDRTYSLYDVCAVINVHNSLGENTVVIQQQEVARCPIRSNITILRPNPHLFYSRIGLILCTLTIRYLIILNS